MTPVPAAPVWPARPPGRLRAWAGDLVTGARLAAGGNRAGWLRIATVAVGIGFAVAVLLLAASVGAVRDAQDRRDGAVWSVATGPVPGVDPLYLRPVPDTYGDREIRLTWVRAGGPRAPVPPGLARVPGPGEQVVSPALARLLAAPDGALLRARYGARTIGTIGRDGLVGGPGELAVYAGSADLRGEAAYGFGDGEIWRPLPPLLWVLLVVGVTVLLFPMFVLVAAVSRLSAAQRERRLAAIRLVGAGPGQVRRIAAGEVLAGTLLGLVAGAGLFLAARRLVEWEAVGGAAAFGGVRPFAEDVVPARPLVLLILLGVPVLAVSTTLLALRGTVIEPLRTARAGMPAPPRLRWRLVPLVAGTVLLAVLGRPEQAARPSATAQLVAGALLVLLAVPALLPWVLHRLVRRRWAGTPALELATGRLRLDSGPAARLVGGLAVTLTGAITLGALLVAAGNQYVPPDPAAAPYAVARSAGGSLPAGLAATLRAVPGVTGVTEFRRIQVRYADSTLDSVTVAPCPALRDLFGLASCADGRWYGTGGGAAGAADPPGRVVGPDGGLSPVTVRPPERPEPLQPPPDGVADGTTLFATPAAVAAVPARLTTAHAAVGLDGDPATLERVRTAVVVSGAQVELAPSWWSGSRAEARSLAAIRRGLLAGALVMLTLGAAAVLVLCLQQVRDARPPLAALAAAGVPRAVLARALGWQNAIPLALAVLLADAAAVLLVLLLRPITSVPVGIDRPMVALLDGAALLAGALVTALALPAVRAASRPEGLRTE